MANEKRLIDANALLAELDKFANPMPNKSGHDFLCGMATAITEIEDAPTVDAVEAVHGRWEQVGDYYVCGDYCYRCTNCMTDKWMTFAHMKRFLYCPFCGAKMDGGNEDG